MTAAARLTLATLFFILGCWQTAHGQGAPIQMTGYFCDTVAQVEELIEQTEVRGGTPEAAFAAMMGVNKSSNKIVCARGMFRGVKQGTTGIKRPGRQGEIEIVEVLMTHFFNPQAHQWLEVTPPEVQYVPVLEPGEDI